MNPGWYGKLPALGDFASRRLPPLFIEPWDRWLAAGLAHWRETEDRWLDAYLAAPTWRFLLGAGVPFAPSPGYAGVLMPSVDRVGRYFPLTAARIRGAQESAAPLSWLHALEGCSVAALQGDWDAERFDTELDSLDAQSVADSAAGFDWPDKGRTLWWCEREGEVSAPVGVAGLPQGGTFVQLLSGRL